MKTAFMSFSTPTLSLAETLSLADRLGYDGIEPRAGSNHAHGIEADTSESVRAEIKAQVSDSPTVLCCLAVSCRFANPESAAQNIEETHLYIDLAADLDIPMVRVFGGQIPEGIPRENAIENVASALSQVAGHAEDRGVTICMETHDDWCDPKHVAAVMSRVDSPGVAVNWDILHPVRKHGYTMADSFQILQPWVKHTHIHDAVASPDTLEMLPIGQGDIDHHAALTLLKKDGYSGYLSGEWINWEPYEIHLPREHGALTQILSQI